MPSFSYILFRELITDRLRLRQLIQEDAPFIYLLRSNKEVNKFINRALATSEKEALDFILRINDGIRLNQSLYWLIVLKNENKAVGTVALWQFSSEENSAEIGYELMPQYQGKGIMQEALERIILYVFENVGLKNYMPGRIRIINHQ